MRRVAAMGFALAFAWPAEADPALVLEISPPASAVVGARAEIGISVAAPAGLALHELAPLFVDLEGPDALGIDRKRLERTDAVRFDAPAAAFRVVIRPTAPGTHVLGARVRAWVCRGARCRAVETRRVARVTVTARP